MKAYVTKKENICVFTPAGQKQRGKSYVRSGKNKENNKTIEDSVSLLLKEFNGEIIDAVSFSPDLYPIRNIV
jgi:hypothetical protein